MRAESAPLRARLLLDLAPRALALLAVSALAGCPVPATRECREYVACQRIIDDSVDVRAYEQDGICWTNFRTAAECTSQCGVALEALRALPDVDPDCGASAP